MSNCCLGNAKNCLGIINKTSKFALNLKDGTLEERVFEQYA